MRVARLADVGLTGAENNPLECEVMPNSETTIELDIPAIHRGLLHLPRLALESRYPVGLGLGPGGGGHGAAGRGRVLGG